MSKFIVVKDDWMRILVDPTDSTRKPSEVITYKMSPEELAKYKTEPYKKPTMIGVREMKRREQNEMEETVRYEIKKLTKAEVVRLTQEGKSRDEIFDIFIDTWQGQPRTLKANIAKFAKDKSSVVVEKTAQKMNGWPVKYYISTGYDNKDEAIQLAKVIEAAGGKITCQWWELGYTEDAKKLAQIGEIEIRGIWDADVVVVMMPGAHGTHTELGAALALGKKILLYGTGEFGAVPFYHVEGVRKVVGSSMDLVIEVLKARG